MTQAIHGARVLEPEDIVERRVQAIPLRSGQDWRIHKG